VNIPSIADIQAAAERIRPYAHRTPVMTSAYFDRLLAANVFFKCENFQRVGAFKFRGACNAVFSLPEGAIPRGVATHSSGNHAQALALAARLRGMRAFIVMPRNAPKVKRQAVADYGAEIIPCEPTVADREATTERVVAETGATLVHPYNDPRIIAGQGTAALELLEEVWPLDLLLAPVGGGGLISGTAIAAAAISPHTRVIAAEPAGADDAYRSLQGGEIVPSVNPQTIADGLRTSLGDLTFAAIRRHVSQIVTVSEEGIVMAMRQVWERMKIVIEPSAAVPLAALLENKIDVRGQRIGVILSGGNVDLDNLPFSRSS
jgi:threonine dehydratase